MRIAAIMQQASKALNMDYGTLAVIDENWCIGCTLCLDACPTDAILGANKRMHTILEAYCTGCELCLPVCPVDCIELVQAGDGIGSGWDGWSSEQAEIARTRYIKHQRRRPSIAEQTESMNNTVPISAAIASSEVTDSVKDAKKSAIATALSKARSRLLPLV